MKALAFPRGNDPAIISGESGGAGLAGLLVLLADERLRLQFGLDDQAHILLINTENASDAAQFEAIVGCTPEEIANHSISEAEIV